MTFLERISMLYISITILFLYLFLYVVAKNYEKEYIFQIDKKEHPLKSLYPLGLYLYDRMKLKLLVKRNTSITKEYLKELYLLEAYPVVERLYYCKKIVFSIFLFFLFNLFILFSNINTLQNKAIIDGRYIVRPSTLDPSKSVDLKVYMTKEDEVKEENIQLDVHGREYTSDEFYNLIEGELSNIDRYILGENDSLDYVVDDLALITSIPNTPIQINWTTNNLYLIKENGKVFNNELLESELVELTATISYKEHKVEYISFVNLYPKTYKKEEQDRMDLIKSVEEAILSSRSKEQILLPDKLKEYELVWRENINSSTSVLLILGILSSFLVYIAMDKDLEHKVEKRKEQLLLDYPEMVHKFTLYVGAGMSLSSAWTKIVQEYINSNKRKRYLYEEMLLTHKELTLGRSEVIAYESFGRRLKLLPFLKFSSLLAQNATIGTATLLAQLELEVADAFIERKELAKKLGEEAGTKLLLPMMIMLFIVLLIIIVPAFTTISV